MKRAKRARRRRARTVTAARSPRRDHPRRRRAPPPRVVALLAFPPSPRNALHDAGDVVEVELHRADPPLEVADFPQLRVEPVDDGDPLPGDARELGGFVPERPRVGLDALLVLEHVDDAEVHGVHERLRQAAHRGDGLATRRVCGPGSRRWGSGKGGVRQRTKKRRARSRGEGRGVRRGGGARARSSPRDAPTVSRARACLAACSSCSAFNILARREGRAARVGRPSRAEPREVWRKPPLRTATWSGPAVVASTSARRRPAAIR